MMASRACNLNSTFIISVLIFLPKRSQHSFLSNFTPHPQHLPTQLVWIVLLLAFCCHLDPITPLQEMDLHNIFLNSLQGQTAESEPIGFANVCCHLSKFNCISDSCILQTNKCI